MGLHQGVAAVDAVRLLRQGVAAVTVRHIAALWMVCIVL